MVKSIQPLRVNPNPNAAATVRIMTVLIATHTRPVLLKSLKGCPAARPTKVGAGASEDILVPAWTVFHC